jgi:acyl-CoA thioester hydrolase
MVYEHRLRVRYAETDQMGVVHHASYVVYVEEARTRWLATLGCSYADLERRGCGLAVRKLEARYWQAACFEDELSVLCRVVGVRGASVTFGYEVQRLPGRERIFTGATELASVDLRDRPPRPTPLPDELRALLAGLVA